ncbi:MAG: hypothetical protein COB67_02625 [SAR324 cluster bacterium]|uniref:Uncharacterized protein n=1 Tax=SAR324 cluster bacterium TaxID=2024889 RepID=A0A2A4T9A2_9DELT|nr:MAG: hypothetical protein COB67_02625 [SAR324 cluster bacterium]
MTSNTGMMIYFGLVIVVASILAFYQAETWIVASLMFLSFIYAGLAFFNKGDMLFGYSSLIFSSLLKEKDTVNFIDWEILSKAMENKDDKSISGVENTACVVTVLSSYKDIDIKGLSEEMLTVHAFTKLGNGHFIKIKFDNAERVIPEWWITSVGRK